MPAEYIAIVLIKVYRFTQNSGLYFFTITGFIIHCLSACNLQKVIPSHLSVLKQTPGQLISLLVSSLTCKTQWFVILSDSRASTLIVKTAVLNIRTKKTINAYKYIGLKNYAQKLPGGIRSPECTELGFHDIYFFLSGFLDFLLGEIDRVADFGRANPQKKTFLI